MMLGALRVCLPHHLGSCKVSSCDFHHFTTPCIGSTVISRIQVRRDPEILLAQCRKHLLETNLSAFSFFPSPNPEVDMSAKKAIPREGTGEPSDTTVLAVLGYLFSNVIYRIASISPLFTSSEEQDIRSRYSLHEYLSSIIISHSLNQQSNQ